MERLRRRQLKVLGALRLKAILLLQVPEAPVFHDLVEGDAAIAAEEYRDQLRKAQRAVDNRVASLLQRPRNAAGRVR